MNILISIIVPIYNIENYIEKCINSILNQNFKNFELVLVDDGSKDKSGEIIDKYKNNKLIKILHKSNGGLSDARNYGINNSMGKYIMFIDGDDYLYDNNCLSKIANFINENDSDIVQFKMVYYYENKNKYVKTDNVDISNNLSKISFLKELNSKGQLSVSACNKIYKRSLIVNNDLFFQKELLSEDILWTYKLLLKAKKMSNMNEDIYVYRQQRLNSISTTKSKKNAEDIFYIINYWLNYKYPNEELKNLYYNFISYWYIILRTNYNKNYYNENMINSFKYLDNMMLNYSDNYKVKKAKKMSDVIGFNNTIKVMKIYIFLKNKGLIKL